MNTSVKLAIALAAGAAALASPALAQHHQAISQRTDAECRQDRRTSATVGGVLGAGAGGAAGRALAAAGVRPEGVVLGAVVGAFVGNRLGREAVYCPPPEYYTQQQGRAYGEVANPYQPQPHSVQHQHQQHDYAPQGHAPQGYVQPAYQPPVHQQQVAPPPRYAQPVLAQPVYQHQAQVQQSSTHWYAPSPTSFYGRERSGVVVPVWSAPPTPHAVPRVGYAPVQSIPCCAAITQSYSYGPVYQPAPQPIQQGTRASRSSMTSPAAATAQSFQGSQTVATYSASIPPPPPPPDSNDPSTIVAPPILQDREPSTIVAPPMPSSQDPNTIVGPPVWEN